MENPFEYESNYVLPCEKVTARLNRLARAETDRQTFSSGIYGLFGSGKTNFLKTYFSPERCRALAEKGQLYPAIMATRSPKPEALFADIYQTISEYIAQYVPEGKLPVFPPLGEDIADSDKHLKEMVKTLREEKYRVFLVIDEFHRISQCETIRDEHYEVFRNLKENEATKLHYIVATDCDFDPQNTSHTNTFTTSFFVHAFDGNSETVGGMSRTEMDAYLAGFLAEGAAPLFTKEEADTLYALTGGFPRIVRKTADILYRLKCAQKPQDELRVRAGAAVREQFELWCESLTTAQKALLKKMALEGFAGIYQKDEIGPYNALQNRGFVVEECGDKYNTFDKKWFCCELFADYVKESFEAEYESVYGARAEVCIDEGEQRECLAEAKKVKATITQKLRELADSKGFSVKMTVRTFKKLEAELDRCIEELETKQCDAEMVETYTTKIEKIRREYKGRMI